MTIFATIGGVLTPENHLKLTKGLVQMNHLARMAYPEATDINTTVRVIYIPALLCAMLEQLQISWKHFKNNAFFNVLEMFTW
jgi:hypothetical protein